MSETKLLPKSPRRRGYFRQSHPLIWTKRSLTFAFMKHISILVPNAEPQLVCIVGCYKAFKMVNKVLLGKGKQPMFDVQLVGSNKNVGLDEGIFSIKVEATLDEVKKTNLIIIPAMSWNFTEVVSANKELYPWIVGQYKNGAEVASVCTGGFLLASTGLLKGRSCSTHWQAADTFRKMFPDVNLVVEKIITDENGIYTNGGAFSFLHLLMYLVEKYCGREVAIYCSKFLEIDIDRHSQSAFTMFTGQKDHQDEDIRKAQEYIEMHADEKISIENLASRFNIGRRNFDRRFIKATSNTPVEYLQRVRIEAAKNHWKRRVRPFPK